MVCADKGARPRNGNSAAGKSIECNLPKRLFEVVAFREGSLLADHQCTVEFAKALVQMSWRWPGTTGIGAPVRVAGDLLIKFEILLWNRINYGIIHHRQNIIRPIHIIMEYYMDACDNKILSLIQKDASITNKRLSERIRLSPAATLARLNKLRDAGIVRQFTAILDEKRLGYGISTITFVNLSPHNRSTANNFVKCVKKIPQIQECHNITGNWDYMLRIISKDIQSYRDFVIDQLLGIGGVNRIETVIILNTEKETRELPL